MDASEAAKALGSIGGKASVKKNGKGFMRKISAMGVEARRAKAKKKKTKTTS